MLKVYPSETTLSVGYMNFESLYDLNKARSWSKLFLQNYRNDLILWNSYAQLEKRAKNIDAVSDFSNFL